jgi:outer membrane protein TolC
VVQSVELSFRRTVFALTIAATALAAVPALAQTTNAALTVEQAVEIALDRSPEILSAEREVEAARGRAIAAGSLPSLQVGVEFEEMPGLQLGRAGTTTIGAAQEIPFPGKLGLQGDVASMDVRAFEAEARRVRRRVAAEVRQQYFLARFLQERIRDLVTSEELLADFAGTSRSRFEAGQAPYLDVIRAKLELSRLRNDLIEARRDSEQSIAELNLLLGRGGGVAIELASPLAPPSAAPDRDAAVARAVNESAALEAARWRLDASRGARRLASRSYLPDFSLSFSSQSVRDAGEREAFWAAGLGVSLPLWWNAPRGIVREAEANLQSERAQFESLTRQVQAAAEQGYDAVVAAGAQVSLFETSILDDLDTELQTGIDGYQTGHVDALDLIDIYRTNVDARTEYRRALYLYLSALARLEAAGDLEP